MASAVPISPEKLLEIAPLLAYDGQGRARPSPAYLRKAISSAYYALFHAIARRAAESALPHGTTEDHLRLARAFNHGEMKTVCGWITGQGQGLGRTASLSGIAVRLKGTAIETVAQVFWDLQEERHAADHDHLKMVTKAGALSQIALAERAISAIDGSTEAERSAFFLLLIAAARPRR